MTRKNFSKMINFASENQIYCEATEEIVLKIKGWSYQVDNKKIYIALLDHTQGQDYVVTNNFIPEKLLQAGLKTKLYDVNHVRKEGRKIIVKDYIFDELCSFLLGI